MIFEVEKCSVSDPLPFGLIVTMQLADIIWISKNVTLTGGVFGQLRELIAQSLEACLQTCCSKCKNNMNVNKIFWIHSGYFEIWTRNYTMLYLKLVASPLHM